MDVLSSAEKHQPSGPLATGRAPRRSGLRVGMAVIATCAALTLTGCAPSDSAYAVLDRDAQPADEVPEALPAYAWDTADPTTARFVGKHDGTSLWLARGGDKANACLLAYVDEDAWILSCGGSGSSFGADGVAGAFTVVPDGAPSPDGMTQISDNVFTSTAEQP
ncbi:hypothetical protein ACSS7Z_15120 [Microbacterium sp. A82]|uniref:hypothetical protein n=1 Tax=unclassified Microbacterium TaxID=2609290 RepID=UPI003F3996BE